MDPKLENALEHLLHDTLKEQRAKRRWGILFKSLFFGYFVILLFLLLPTDLKKTPLGSSHTAVVTLQGVIDANANANAEDVNDALNRAFDNPNSKAVIIELNSPGGSPVQAGQIYDEMRRLQVKYPEKPVYAVISDTCASGCYYVAAAAKDIYANEASLVGSIGVLFDGFGFTGLMEKIGVERRLITAGVNKAFLDPFEPMTPAHKDFMADTLKVVHQQFINKVKEGRSGRLKDNPELFTGLIWTGEQGIGLGLVDKLGSSSMVARDVVQEPVMVDYMAEEPLLARIGKRFGTAINQTIRAFLTGF